MTLIISKMIVHKLNINNPLPILNDTCIDLSNTELQEALPFFQKHIMNSRRQGAMKRCQFADIEDNSIRKSMTKIIEVQDTCELDEIFIEESRWLTRRLAERIRSSSSRSDGSLFVVLYQDNEKKFVGLLKMDPNDGVQVNADLSIKVRKDMLPSINEKLHKSALIELKEYRENEFHLFVLDKQKGINDPARYFMEYFLNAKELSSARNMTKLIQSEIDNSFDQIIEVASKPKLNSELRKRFLEQDRFDIDTDLEPILRPLLKESFRDLDLTESISDFKDKILQVYPDAQFNFAPDEDAVKEVIFRTPNKNVELRFSPTLIIEDDYLIEPRPNGDVVVTLKNGIGIELEQVHTRR
ncbi:nucleoid-associated protein [Enterococcus sp. PF-2]|uniref:nucleoid-associated protein n=1 Tax=unclassified Enterococcus TaxID=2608891 RepID=UPI00111F6C53|nr:MULTISPECIES: nucleoid-associated protein [unclassified Enterococcus]TPE00255.1 nucleoid-associated protein [Enterococcus sp. PF-3]TPE23591.1 nucleoid-associated protein [Enterococcus sp. PF-2]